MRDTEAKARLQPIALKTSSPNCMNACDIKEMARRLQAAGERMLANMSKVGDPSEVADLLHDVTTQLFKDAGVEYQRTNLRGLHHSIVEAAYEEFMRWYDMPWE
jgi:hypothetical protein